MVRGVIAIVLIAVAGCEGNQGEITILRGATMGTTYAVMHRASRVPGGVEQQAIDSLLLTINLSLSTYIDSSSISQINRSSDTTRWYPVDDHFVEVFTAARRVFRETNGAFNPAVGPLVNAWGFGPDGRKPLPDRAAIDSLLALTDFNSFDFRQSPARVRKRLSAARLDFGAIAKGYGVDAVGRLVESFGQTDYFVEIGGEVRTRGIHPDGRAWRVGIELPTADRLADASVHKVVTLSDAAIATSGNYRNFYERDGQRFVHIVNPATGRADSTSLLSVSVLATDCMTADAYATAFMVLGVARSRELMTARADSQDILGALFVTSHPSGRFEEQQWPPGVFN